MVRVSVVIKHLEVALPQSVEEELLITIVRVLLIIMSASRLLTI